MGAVTVLIALVCHKWVESLALSARCLKIGANWWYVHFYRSHNFFIQGGRGMSPELGSEQPFSQRAALEQLICLPRGLAMILTLKIS